ncbi:hypothetical protein ARAM_004518 [Aspergillus rambellii]|uniref:EKC/KEOPS complex subunit BUD32 n=1 Tax=Aspergillus rambellii TaxID=308745 RepID=A0A0F8WQ91_9EURO|nr:hypothetical protein ARAM_004518 [Aspergillus rambellii]
MELSHRIVDAIWRPSFVLKYHELQAYLHPSSGRTGPAPWDQSPLNPRNLVDSLNNTSSRWRIDGATICGTCIYVIPLDLLPTLPPLGIFLFLLDQTDYPPALRHSLDASVSVPLRDGRAISGQGIAKHLCRALDHYCAQNPDFLDQYLRLPFGSKLILEELASDPASMKLEVERVYDIESKMLTVTALQQLWSDVARDAWPPILDVHDLRLIRQINEAVSLVETPGIKLCIQPLSIFKSAAGSLDHMYHELHLLLTCPQHPHIMSRPLAIVTKKASFGGKDGVVGFLLQYFQAGSIRDILPNRQRSGTLLNSVKLRWCRQIASALAHLNATGIFYSDLRPDNVLLDSNRPDAGVVLCDFEQRGNWYEWCAPEVLYRQYAENIRSRLPARVINPPYDRLLKGYHYSHSLSDSKCYTSAETHIESSNRAWFALPAAAREKATVYNLGLFIYTVFEGLSNVECNIANQFPNEQEVEFPVFRRPQTS